MGQYSSPLFRGPDVLSGVRIAVPVALSSFVYGSVFGVLASGKGLTLAEATGMSATLFAGAAQFVVLELWTHPLPIVLLTLTALAINLRFLLYGATIAPWLAGLTPRQRYGSAFFLADETWAITAGEMQGGGYRGALLLGSGLALYAGWVGGTVTGHVAGRLVEDPRAWGLDFVYVAVFVALLMGLRRGRQDLWPWGVSAAVAVGVEQILPGAWHIIIGGVAGSVAGALRGDR